MAVRRGRWPAVLLVAVAARILLDPGVYAYYTAGALLGTIVVDLVVTRWRVPWATATAAVLLYAARFTHELIPFSLHELGDAAAGLRHRACPWWSSGSPAGGWPAARAARPGPGRRRRGRGSGHVPPGDPHPGHPSGPFPAHSPFRARLPAHPSGPLPVRQPGTYQAHPSGPLPVRRRRHVPLPSGHPSRGSCRGGPRPQVSGLGAASSPEHLVSAEVPGEEPQRAVHLEGRDLHVPAGVGVQRLLG